MKLDDDLGTILACFRLYESGGVKAVRSFLHEQQEFRNDEEDYLDALDAAVRMDPENNHGAW